MLLQIMHNIKLNEEERKIRTRSPYQLALISNLILLIFIIIVILLTSCGKRDDEPAPQLSLTDRAQIIVNNKCMSCHIDEHISPKLLTLDKFRIRGAYWEIKEKRMPPPSKVLKQITDEERSTLLEYFGDVD